MNGEVLTFEDWYRDQHSSVLAAVAMFCVGEHARAEDAANDAFVEAYEKWDSVGQMNSPTGWVVRVAINKAKRSYRRRKRRIELLNTQRLEASSVDELRDLDLLENLAKLPERQRAALVLRYIEDLPQADVAMQMDIAVGTASATLNQARGKLRSELGERNGHEHSR